MLNLLILCGVPFIGFAFAKGLVKLLERFAAFIDTQKDPRWDRPEAWHPECYRKCKSCGKEFKL